jgi:cysteine desulfurase / selenocysteine lyase
MSTSEGAPQVVASSSPDTGSDIDSASRLEGEIQRLAHELFSGTSPPLPAPAIGSRQFGSGAQSLGAGGASPATISPAVPGVPPITSAPRPKESDFRTIPAMLSEVLGAPVPLSPDPASLLGGAPASFTTSPTDGATSWMTGTPSSSPYFLEDARPPHSAISGWPPNAGGASIPSDGPAQADRSAPTPATRAAEREDPIADIPRDFRPDLVPSNVVTSRSIFDAHRIKRDFPILRERIHGRELVWLDNAATTQKPRAVIDRLSTFYERENSNVHRAAHTLAARATDALEKARETTARFLRAPSANQIIFVRGATEAINLVAQSWGRRYVERDDEVVVTWLEHHANIVPWQQLCGEKQARLRVAPVDSRGQVILERYERLLGPKTRIVSLAHVSNALGTVLPVREMIAMAHRHGAVVLVDGAQAVSHMPVDVQALDCDFYAFSGHKVFGPTGIGVLYGKESVLESMPPWQGGGNMIADVTFERTVYQPPPGRFEAGTASIADAAALGTALEYVSALGMETIHQYEADLLEYATEQLIRVPGLTLVGTADDKAGVLSFVLDGVRTQDVGALLDQEGIAVRAGHHCAQPIHRRFGLESTVRASLALYNTREDIDALVSAVRRLREGPSLRPPRPSLSVEEGI